MSENSVYYGAENDYTGSLDKNAQPQAPVTRCPGKEIVGMVLGINSLVWGVLGIFFCWHIGLAIAYGGIGIGTGIAARILHNKVHEQATLITNKIEIGNKLGLAGIICGAVSIVLSIIVLIVLISFGIAGGMLWANS